MSSLRLSSVANAQQNIQQILFHSRGDLCDVADDDADDDDEYYLLTTHEDVDDTNRRRIADALYYIVKWCWRIHFTPDTHNSHASV